MKVIRRTWSGVIIFFVFEIVLLSAGGLFYLAVSSQTSNYRLVAEAMHRCAPLAPALSEKMIIIRLDDVQAFAHRAAALRMMEDAFLNGMPVVAGIIPKDIATDAEMVRFLKRHECNVEVALHGYDHLPVQKLVARKFVPEAEFESIGMREAETRIERGIHELTEISDARITTFIPPENQISPDGTAALASQHVPIVSSGGDGYYDSQSSFWDYHIGTFTTADEIVDSCLEQFLDKNICVITFHPQDIVDKNGDIDPVAYREYLKILAYFDAARIPAVTFASLLGEGTSR